jgi:hypothetical protein
MALPREEKEKPAMQTSPSRDKLDNMWLHFVPQQCVP